jgi:hypothetical protein
VPTRRPKGTAQRREASWTAASTTPSSTGRDDTDAHRAVVTCPHGKARNSDYQIHIVTETKTRRKRCGRPTLPLTAGV